MLRLTLRVAFKLIAAACVCVGIAAALPYPDANIDPNDYHDDDIITRDVCIIGGGSSGTYSAIGLRGLGKSVVVVEEKDRLGGHTQTYIDPATGIPVDYGVVVFHDLPLVKSYFGHFGIPLEKASLSIPGVATQYVDFRTGRVVSAYSPADPTAAFGAYAAQLLKYPYLGKGVFLPDPVPADLLLPFGDFVKKYSLDAAVQPIALFSQGVGNILAQPTLYVMMVFGLDLLQNIQTGFLATAAHDNSALYDAARSELGKDALLSTHVKAMDRDSGPDSKIVVETPSGRRLIRAKKVVIAVPPKLNNLRGFDLDDTERDLFGQFNNSAYYTSLLRHTGIPDNIQFTNVGADTPENLPALPGIYSVSQTGVSGLISVQYGSPTELSNDEVKENIIADLLRLKNDNLATTAGEFATFSSHTPFELTVSTDAIAGGFYKRLYGLQGHRNTFYTGAAWIAHDSSLIWGFTEALLPSITS
jgi:hypothetical protein